MKSVAMLHTVKSVYNSFGETLAQAVGGEMELALYNMLDDYLALDANARGEFTDNNMERLKLDLQSLDRTGADAIVVTCSTLSPHLKEASLGIARPVFAIDEAMVEYAATIGGEIVVMATAESAVGPVTRAIEERCAQLGNVAAIRAVICIEAMTALRSGDRDRHDELLFEASKRVGQSASCVVLAQASMAHMAKPLERALGLPVLESLFSCANMVAEYLSKGEKACR